MKGKNVNVSVNVAESMKESAKTKGAKVRGKAVTSQTNAPTRKETKLDFISYIHGKEQISVSKIFRLLNDFKAEYKQRYSDYCSAHNLNVSFDYSFSWFSANCPKDENGMFAKWVKVSEKVSKNSDDTYNRVTEKGVVYTLVAFDTSKANYEQFLPIFLSVVSELKRIEREKAKAEKAKAKAEEAKVKAEKAKEKALKSAKEIYNEVSEISATNGIPFETALQVYASIKKLNVSEELKAVLAKMQKGTK